MDPIQVALFQFPLRTPYHKIDVFLPSYTHLAARGIHGRFESAHAILKVRCLSPDVFVHATSHTADAQRGAVVEHHLHHSCQLPVGQPMHLPFRGPSGGA